MVCGSTHHPYRIDDSAISKALFDLQQQQEQQAIALEQTKFNAWQTQQHALTQCRAELEQVQKYLAQLQVNRRTYSKNLSKRLTSINYTLSLIKLLNKSYKHLMS